MRSRSIVLPIHLIAGCLFALTTFSQTRDKVKFGKISPEDFTQTSFEKDTSAHAVILADIGSSEYQAARDHFEIVYKRFKRIKVVDKNGYEEANVEIGLYVGDQAEEKLSNLKAVAYNLENGQVVETKLESKGVFTDKDGKNHVTKKFSIPAVKEGTIIEYTYSITSPYYDDLKAWNFQYEHPCVLSEYTVIIPEIYDFVFLKQDINGMLAVKTATDRQTFNMSFERTPTGPSQHGSFSANTTTHAWTAKNIPALKLESFTTSLRNHITRIEFQLSAIKYPGAAVKPVMSSWEKFAEELNKHELFGADLNKNNGYLGDIVDQLTAGLKDDTAKARRIYNYVRTNFTCTDHSRLLLSKSLKSIFTSHSGNEADINLLLIAMLHRANLNADPLILSTRDHGFTNELYPLASRFNYAMAALTVDTLTYFLDASHPYLGFGRVDMSCYNGHARVLAKDGVPPVYFNPDELLEAKNTFVMLMAGEDGSLKGSMQQYPTYFESCAIRSSIKDKGKDAYFKGKEKDFAMETAISGVELENLDDNEDVLKMKFDFEMKADDAGILYINPLFTEATRKNPFRSQERRYPVEMPCVMDETFTLNMTVPDGYVIEELPKSAVVKFNENEGVFQYLIQQSENNIQFRSKVKLSRAVFAPDEYNSLRDFFDMIVKKQSEQIVLKKKS